MNLGNKKALIPFVIFVLITGFLAVGLTLKPGEVPSPFIGKPAPDFDLPRLTQGDSTGDNTGDYASADTISNSDLDGQVWLLNVWASWCVACRDEHPLLNQLSTGDIVPIVGLNYKDQQDDAKNWLNQFGNPYTIVAVDKLGQTGIEYGVYGVPETFVIDKNGIIQLKHIGPLTREDIEQTVIPLVQKLQGETG
jgi:cytochrome c biogenesis protein CcmG/thiol:disulfide interchange protein DsbE